MNFEMYIKRNYILMNINEQSSKSARKYVQNTYSFYIALYRVDSEGVYHLGRFLLAFEPSQQEGSRPERPDSLTETSRPILKIECLIDNV